MVKWRGREGSKNVEDRRGVGAAAGMSGLAILLIRFVMSRWGLGGVAVLVAGFFALQAVGINPMALLSGQPASGSRELSAADQEAGQFVGVVLAETEATWSDFFARSGQDYPEPKLVMFSGKVESACGFASAASGPFYCPADQQVYLDTNFFAELSQRFGAPGDFAAAYVVAHEVGHHVQTITGVADKVRRAQARASQEEGNALQVRMELQADCYAGVWAHQAQKQRDFLEPGDIEEGLRAAAAIGDDTLQRGAGRRVTPESFTHGTSEQRQQWFYRGYKNGDPGACDTFSE
ncbi:MAG: neutral zinc metallopeptidase [Parvularculaceae bacterium]|jgi:hypothetical protein|nr:neutral zinc metallopeptidase [Parvularculaceae bacterium]